MNRSQFLLYSPLNQGLKLMSARTAKAFILVFTLQSIKSRIETDISAKQGAADNIVFTLQSIKSRIETISQYSYHYSNNQFLLYSPLNQGLKLLNFQIAGFSSPSVFTLQSIKSRIETYIITICRITKSRFLLYSPLNQGLKLIFQSN